MNKTQPAVQSTASTPEQRDRRLNALVCLMCTVKKEIDKFYESPDGDLMREVPDRYLAAERKMNAAIGHIAEYIGTYTVENLMSHE